jgi:hypothetical protein
MAFGNWEAHFKLYPNSKYMRETEYHLLFLNGLTPVLKNQIQQEKNDLLVFQRYHRSSFPKTTALLCLQARGIFNCLSAIIAPLALESSSNTSKQPNISAIVTSLDQVLQDPIKLERFVNWCTQLNDPDLTNALVAAFQHSNFRQQSCPPLPDKQPAALCIHLHCSKMHSPDDCCICINQRHPIKRCLHIIGLLEGKTHMATQFKSQHESQSGPWTAKAVIGIDFVASMPTAASIQQPDANLKQPPLNLSGILLSEAEGDILKVKEMDELYSHGFKSIFMQHHLANQPNVSAIPTLTEELIDITFEPTTKANLPDDGPEVSFVSCINRTDTVVAHVDTRATVMVSNVFGDIHGAVPTTAHCGNAMTGSKANIDAIGTWRIDFVGSKEGKDLSLALRGMTQITDFQRRSISLHALKELGFDCAHILTQQGNFLEITVATKTHCFQLITINGGDYIEMRVHPPPIETLAAAHVAWLDLVKNFKAERLYHLLHLCYGFFCCPICNKDKTNSLPSVGISNKTFLPIGVRFHGDFGFYNTISVRGVTCFLLLTEAVTGYKWIFCRRSKHPPINLLLWFIRQLRQRLGVTFAVLRTNGGGELWGCKELCDCRTQKGQCNMEPTGAYNSAANGMAERGIGVVCVQAQICLYALGLDVQYRCFPLSHATVLCTMRPCLQTEISSHEAFLKKVPNYSNLAIWGSPVYVVD